MGNKDNVYEDTTLTEEFAGASENGASTVLGKFKDVSALERAYESLQAEFTRRSQKLRELEKTVENFKKEQAAQSGAEKLRKTAKAKREEQRVFDEFIADMGMPSASEKKPYEVSVGEEKLNAEGAEAAKGFETKSTENEETERLAREKLAQGQEKKETVLDVKESGVREVALSSVAGSEARGSAEDLFERAVNDEAVRLRIIGEYLASIGKSGAPITAVGGGMLATPSAKAKTIGEAGDMALQYLRKPIV